MGIERSIAIIERIITEASFHLLKWKRISADSVPILAYHEICDLPEKISRKHPYNVAPSAFREQMEFLFRGGYSVLRLEDLASWLTKERAMPSKAVVITFDDGYKNNYSRALPVLREYGFPATIFLATDYIGRHEAFPWLRDLAGEDDGVKENWIPLSWHEVKEMSEAGVAFGCHTCSHASIRNLDRTDFQNEIESSRDIIEKQIGKRVNLFSYPFSFPKYRRRYAAVLTSAREILLREGFIGACTTIIGTNPLGNDPFCLKRIQIKNTDTLSDFNAKLVGAYNWASLGQSIKQKIVEPLSERRREFTKAG